MIRLRRWALSVVMIAAALVMMVPFYFIIVTIFKTQGESLISPLSLPSSLNFDNFVTAFTTMPLGRAALNTFAVTTVSVVLMLLIGSMAAFGTVVRETRTTRVVKVLMLIGILIPFQTIMVPVYRMFAQANLADSLPGITGVYLIGSIFCYMLIRGYMSTVPKDLFEAARVDGASDFTIYFRIVLPLIRPILVTVGVFQTMWVWNDFIIPSVFISSPEKSTLVLQAYRAVSQFSTNWPMFMTVTVIALVPTVVFFFFAQRHIVSGLVAGSVKG